MLRFVSFNRISLLSILESRGLDVSNQLRSISLGPSLNSFAENHPKGRYKNINKPSDTRRDRIRMGLKQLKQEIKVWTEEVKDALEFDPVMTLPLPGEVDMVWTFNDKTNFDNWVVTSDSDHKEGYSTSSLSVSPVGKGLFSGNLCTELIKDGKVKKSGYCNIRSIRPQKSFKRDSYHDWSSYTHLVLRVRGDGRSYMINIGTAGYFDVNWNDAYHFALFTRGGPHWQISRIPFSKFFLASKGRVQDNQGPLPLERITSFGITAGDKINGPFRLEIDYIGLEYDPSHTEVHAYEKYRVPPFFGGY